MGETETPYFYDFGFFERAPEPNTNYFYLWRPRNTSNKSRKILNHFGQYYVINRRIVNITNFEKFRKDGRRQIPTILLNRSWSSWIWDQYLPENMEWTFSQSLKLWNQETKQLLNQQSRIQATQTTHSGLRDHSGRMQGWESVCSLLSAN